MMRIDSANAPALDLPARFMALSIIAAAASAISTPWSLPLLQGNFDQFSLLAFVHLNTLGFIGAMIIGASYQLVPVAMQVPLASVRFGRISFWFFGPGLVLFLIGLARTSLIAMAAGASLLGIGFALYVGIILATWRGTPDRDVVAWHLAIGALNGGAGMLLGVSLAFNKRNGMLGDDVFRVLAAHITVMVGGWVLLTLFGVAYRLIGMFTLAEQHFVAPLAWAELSLVAAGTWLLALRFVFSWPARLGQAAGFMLLAGIGCFAIQIGRMYRLRMRRAPDIHMPFALLATACALATGCLLSYGLARRAAPNDPLWVAIIWLLLFGVAETAIQGFFYKIATFLVWLKRYAPIAGAQPVPRLEALYSRRVALAGWGFWTASILAVTIAILTDLHRLNVLAMLMIAGVACFLINVVSIASHWPSGLSKGSTRTRPLLPLPRNPARSGPLRLSRP